MASVKHYAAYGQPEGGREYNTTDMSESVLHNLYLPPLLALNEHITVSAPASIAALNGGR